MRSVPGDHRAMPPTNVPILWTKLAARWETDDEGDGERWRTYKVHPVLIRHALLDSIPQDRQGLTAFSDLLFPFSYLWPTTGCCTRFVIKHLVVNYERAESCPITFTSVGDRRRIRLAPPTLSVCTWNQGRPLTKPCLHE
ncbi:uncharacterized protein LACBIDRAFT_311015 [Laccaria bicolor S238N-H82]|uniref:Predicted protein n=1 Tax=Laccaria bicolor (strain S238N-H82 / ATCC MYA-4686) TaxID=486041 RepID=B0DVJ5_LACBS|nr:uncharacterized protein LACBIDRAFT_311015 [Laccaria bicolor S238N-H82]EDR01429.1 predicted protein [Laccaria bicolor S238N-H82]|eukprot:XP_001887974.1 predicted protein [Laccaria bicolor S238N-H82]